MKSKLITTTLFAAIVFVLFGFVKTGNEPVSPETQECIDCHRTITPGIVADWENGYTRKQHPFRQQQTRNMKDEFHRQIFPKTLPVW